MVKPGKGSLVGAKEAFEELVHQFSDPMAFIRELIQNSLDAASTRIDVRFSFEGPAVAEAEGLGTVEVQDNGEGMDERVIDDYLLTLFSSTKEGDQTKIGKFGIGFVSIFAVAPDLVVVETGRGVEAWRVRLRKGGRFEKVRLSSPIEGTSVRLHKRTTRKDFDELRRRGVEAARFWCKFAECEIVADGQPIREEFGLAAPLAVHHVEEGTDLWVGFAPLRASSPDDEALSPQVGLYNRGLTLLEGTRLPGDPADLAGLSVRVKSRHLEHTLTRDDVRQDEGYDRLLALVRRVVAEQLRPRLVEQLVRLARPPAEEPSAAIGPREAYRYARLPSMELDPLLRNEPVLPVFAGEPLAARALGKLKGPGGALLVSSVDDRATRLLRQQGVAVLRDPGGLAPFLARLASLPVQRVEQVFCAPAPVELSAAGQALVAKVEGLLREADLKVERVLVGQVEDAASPWARRLLLRQREAFGLTRPDHDDRATLLGGARQLVLLRGHALVERCLALAPIDPGLAALLLIAAVLLHQEADSGRVADLAARCLTREGGVDGA